MNDTVNAANQQAELKDIEVDYHFRKKDGVKRPSVSVKLPVPTTSALVSILQDTTDDTKKVRDLLTDAINSVVVSYVKGKVDADEAFNQESLDAIREEITIQKIANLPKSDRAGVSKEDLEAFAKVYVAIMPELSGVSQKGAESAGAIFVSRMRLALGNNAALEALQKRLTEFVEKAPEEVTAEHQVAIEYLLGRMDEALGITFDVNAL